MKHIATIFTSFVLAIPMLVGNVFAQVAPYTLYGTSGFIESEYQEDMAVQVTSDSGSYGGIDFDVPVGTTLEELTHLSTDFSVLSGTCGGGSPRFQINMIDSQTRTEQMLYAYIGEGSSFTCSSSTWQKSGNLLGKDTFIDATQAGSLFYTPYEEVIRYFGTNEVTGIELVLDSGWMFGEQSVVFDNIRVNDQTFTFPTH